MLRVAGELSDGTLATWSNERAIESVIGPGVREAAKDAGRPEPRVGAVVPVTLTHDVTRAREQVREHFAIYDSLPRYKRMVELGGTTSAAEVCIVGDEAELRRRLRAFSDAGLTDLLAAPFAAGDDRSAAWTKAERELLESLRDKARSLGANAVVGLEVTLDPFAKCPKTEASGLRLHAVGTAAKLEPLF